MARSSKNKKKKTNSSGKTIYKGTIEVTRSGLGYVTVEGQAKDIIVKRENLKNALNGDEVKIEVTTRGKRFGARPEGTIVDIIRRKQVEFSGRVQVHKNYAFLLPDSDKMPVDIFIPESGLNGAKNGDKAIARITEWTAKDKNPEGEIISILT